MIGKDDKVTYLDRGFGRPAIRACDRCGSLIAFEDEDTHRTWHHALNTIVLALRPAMVTQEEA